MTSKSYQLSEQELREMLIDLRKFIEYARYELQPGESQFGDQFPRQGCADKRLAAVDQALAALAERPATSGWQPIETAPKNRENIILAAHFIREQWLVSAGWHWTWHTQPTHWMPAPGTEPEAERGALADRGVTEC